MLDSAFIDQVAERVAAIVLRELRGSELAAMVDQKASPLGSKRHCAAVRRRLDTSMPGAAKVGRRHLLSPAALSEELAAVSVASTSNDVVAGLERIRTAS